MAMFKEANQVRVSMKMKLSMHAWYSSSAVVAEGDGYHVVVVCKQINNQVRKMVAPVVNGVSIKLELE